MAWRIDEQLVRGEIDNRVRGRVTGRLWFLGREEPVTLELEGNAWRDVAGHVLRFANPAPKARRPGELRDFATVQRGLVGDITASRKVKVPECSMEELGKLCALGKPFPWHWGNSLYLEWHGERNGRVVIESVSYQIEISGDATWSMSEAEEAAQREANGRAMTGFMERLAKAAGEAKDEGARKGLPPAKADDAKRNAGTATPKRNDDSNTDAEGDGEPPAGEVEASADVEQARMDLLLDRVQARIARAKDAGEEPDLEQIMEEERVRLRRERGEPEPEPPTPEEEAERAAWIEEMNAAAEEALKEMESEKWKRADGAFDDGRWHPLVERCNALSHRLLDETKARGWLGEEDPHAHPLREVVNGVMIAGGKLAGALGTVGDADDWPPDALCAGSTLTRLKKARGYLRDALAGLDAADEQDLGGGWWRGEVRAEAQEILAEVERLIREVRAVLKLSEESGRDEK